MLISVLKKFNILLDKKAKKGIVRLFFVALVGTFFEVLGVSMVIPVVSVIMDRSFMEKNAVARKICEIFGIQSYNTFSIMCVAALIFIFIIKALYLSFEYELQARCVCDSRLEFQKKLLHVFLRKPYEYYLGASTAKVLRTVTVDVTETFNLLLTIVMLFAESAVSVSLVITLFCIEPYMTAMVIFILMAMLIFIVKAVKPVMDKSGVAFRENEQKAYEWILQTIHGIKELKVARKEDYFEENFKNTAEKQISAERKNIVFNNIPRQLIELVCMGSAFVAVTVMLLHGRTIEDMVPVMAAFAVVAGRLMPSSLRIVNMINGIAYQSSAIDHLLKSMETVETEHTVSIQDERDFPIKDKITFKGITYRYPNSKKRVLDDISFDIQIGSCIGIVGVSGIGKTTAIDVLLGLLTPEQGEILADGVDIMSNYNGWLSHVGYVPQSLFLLDDSIAANVAFGEEPEEERLWAALRDASLEEFVKSLPEGIHTQVGERGIRLSGGQRQRIGIARALYRESDILIFDEATSSLDTETESDIIQSIYRLRGKKTVIIITHRPQTIEHCDKVYRIKNGQIAEV